MSDIFTNQQHEVKALTILENFSKLLLNQTNIEYEELQEAIKQLKDLEHYSHFTSYLYVTDRPDKIPEDIKDLFWQSVFWKTEDTKTGNLFDERE